MEQIKTFNPNRKDLTPYGLTCEKWKPEPSSRIDQHNEIEINYFPQGGATYFFNNKAIEIPSNRIIVFWAMYPHQTLSFQGNDSYYVCTIPLNIFMSWNIDSNLVNDLFAGKLLISPKLSQESIDSQMMKGWISDLEDDKKTRTQEIVLAEMKARIMRFSLSYSILSTTAENDITYTKKIFSEESNKITKIVDYIARNFRRTLKANEIGQAIGIHPDYANRLCLKAFGCTLHQMVLQLRINYAERFLITTDLPITDIATDCGFSTIARFNATFLKQKQITPSEYRKIYHNAE